MAETTITQDVVIFRFENDTKSSNDISVVWRSPGNGSSLGYYENLVSVTSFEVRGETLWRPQPQHKVPRKRTSENDAGFEPIVNVKEAVVWPNGPVTHE
ncbi:MAG: hypothetical protein R3E66_03495 [bacterium]